MSTTAPARPALRTAIPSDDVALGPATVITREPSAAAEHVLRRLTYGPRPQDRDDIARLGVAAWIDRQLAPQTIADPVADGLLARFPGLDRSIAQTRSGIGSNRNEPMVNLGQATLARAVWSERQLYELMVELWSNRLHVTNPSTDVWDSRPHYDRVIRASALGTFRDLLTNAITHPAMLAYLGADRSGKNAPNENLGRELLELHTVGVDAGYTEADVRASALMLTGLSRDRATGEFLFRADTHYVGPVRIMGFSHPNGSAAGGLDAVRAYLSYLATHPATARGIARILATRFVSDAPSDRLIATLADAYLRNDTAIVPVLRVLFRDPEFSTSVGAKVRRPLEDVAGVLRATGAPSDGGGTGGLTYLYRQTKALGHAPLAWGPPNGYPDDARAWMSPALALARWNTRTVLLTLWTPAVPDAPQLFSLLPDPLPSTWAALVDALSTRLLGRVLAGAERTAVLSYAPAAPDAALPRSAQGWSLLTFAMLIMSTSHHTSR